MNIVIDLKNSIKKAINVKQRDKIRKKKEERLSNKHTGTKEIGCNSKNREEFITK